MKLSSLPEILNIAWWLDNRQTSQISMTLDHDLRCCQVKSRFHTCQSKPDTTLMGVCQDHFLRGFDTRS